jgi:acylaminoacyl-peptidase
MLHGGPHQFLLAGYKASLQTYLQLGFNILQPNYTGSLGFGQDVAEQLPGRIGTVDVEDVYAAR